MTTLEKTSLRQSTALKLTYILEYARLNNETASTSQTYIMLLTDHYQRHCGFGCWHIWGRRLDRERNLKVVEVIFAVLVSSIVNETGVQLLTKYQLLINRAACPPSYFDLRLFFFFELLLVGNFLDLLSAQEMLCRFLESESCGESILLAFRRDWAAFH